MIISKRIRTISIRHLVFNQIRDQMVDRRTLVTNYPWLACHRFTKIRKDMFAITSVWKTLSIERELVNISSYYKISSLFCWVLQVYCSFILFCLWRSLFYYCFLLFEIRWASLCPERLISFTIRNLYLLPMLLKASSISI